MQLSKKLGDLPYELRDPQDFPALYASADSTSLRAQSRFLVALRIRLSGLLAAALGGALSVSLGEIQLGGVLALVGFLAALGAELYSAVGRPERLWYEGRAAAESVKTLAWRYMVRGESFADSDEVEADRRFLGEVRGILHDLDSVELSADETNAVQITERMRYYRAQPFAMRRQLYLKGRIQNQHAWYARKAKWNEDRAHRWVIAGIAFELLGVFGGAARAFGTLEVDVLGLFAALAATITAWIQAKQYQTLAAAYGVTAQELAAVASDAEALDEEAQWAQFVGSAEEAISREHTLWRASRGVRVRPPKPEVGP